MTTRGQNYLTLVRFSGCLVSSALRTNRIFHLIELIRNVTLLTPDVHTGLKLSSSTPSAILVVSEEYAAVLTSHGGLLLFLAQNLQETSAATPLEQQRLWCSIRSSPESAGRSLSGSNTSLTHTRCCREPQNCGVPTSARNEREK